MKYKSVVRVALYVGCLYAYFFGFPAILFAAEVDSDGDGLTDIIEAHYYTRPDNPDTDGDGYLDGAEIEQGYSPLAGEGAVLNAHDYDEDGLMDNEELIFGSDMGNSDTDRDGYRDFDEVMHGYDPLSSASLVRYDRGIEVDRTTQQLYFMVNGTPVLNFPVSTGNPGTPTPAGTFAIDMLIPDKRYVGLDYDLAGVKWNMRFKPMYYIHAAYWHNNFGIRTMSHGCVNMRESDAKILYQYAVEGMTVKIYGTTPIRRVVEV